MDEQRAKDEALAERVRELHATLFATLPPLPPARKWWQFWKKP